MSINITYSTDSNGITTAMFESTESNAVLLNGTDSLKTTVNGKDTIASRAIISGITTIGESAFRDSTSLTSIELDTSVTTIDKFAFFYLYFEKIQLMFWHMLYREYHRYRNDKVL